MKAGFKLQLWNCRHNSLGRPAGQICLCPGREGCHAPPSVQRQGGKGSCTGAPVASPQGPASLRTQCIIRRRVAPTPRHRPQKSRKQDRVEITQTDFHLFSHFHFWCTNSFAIPAKMAATTESGTVPDPRAPTSDDGACTEEGAAGIFFNPPLYIQRYKLVTDFVAKTDARKV